MLENEEKLYIGQNTLVHFMFV